MKRYVRAAAVAAAFLMAMTALPVWAGDPPQSTLIGEIVLENPDAPVVTAAPAVTESVETTKTPVVSTAPGPADAAATAQDPTVTPKVTDVPETAIESASGTEPAEEAAAEPVIDRGTSGTEESVSSVTEEGPLTPAGNLSLVDDIGEAEASGKQFITVVTKSGNYFYLIIDRDEDGKENVHFLNQVDEEDLFALLDEEDAARLRTEMTVPEPTEEPEVIVTETPEIVLDPDKEPKSILPGVMILLLLLIGGAGTAVFILQKKKKEAAETVDPDADYVEEEDAEPQAGTADEGSEEQGEDYFYDDEDDELL